MTLSINVSGMCGGATIHTEYFFTPLQHLSLLTDNAPAIAALQSSMGLLPCRNGEQEIANNELP